MQSLLTAFRSNRICYGSSR